MQGCVELHQNLLFGFKLLASDTEHHTNLDDVETHRETSHTVIFWKFFLHCCQLQCVEPGYAMSRGLNYFVWQFVEVFCDQVVAACM